jgi:hypothetical protein
MRTRPGPALLLLALLALSALCGACGAIPPYSSVRRQDVSGQNAVKLRGTIWNNIQIHSEDLTYPFAEPVGYELDKFSSYGIEFERLIPLADSDRYSLTFGYETRDMQVEGTHTPIQGEQIHAGIRRYFGDRALTAFVAGQAIYHQTLDFPGELDLRESDDFFGIGFGGGANLALSDHFTIEIYGMYELAPGVKTYKRRVDGEDAPADLEFNFSGPMIYLALGYHF